jgi:6,7-dimethyl-8-ribityllumazine synthase
LSSKDNNLSSVQGHPLPSGKGLKISIAVSEWNSEITDSLLKACQEALIESGLDKDDIRLARTPGAFELPFAAKTLIKNTNPDAVICLGCVIKGETRHDEYINSSVAMGITQLSLATDIPVIFGVLTVESQQQAIDRAGGQYGNKGTESAHTALKMVQMKKSFAASKKKIGY